MLFSWRAVPWGRNTGTEESKHNHSQSATPELAASLCCPPSLGHPGVRQQLRVHGRMCGQDVFLHHLSSPLVTPSLPQKCFGDSSPTAWFGSTPYQGDRGEAACSGEHKNWLSPPVGSGSALPTLLFSPPPQRAVGSKKEGSLRTQLPQGTRKPSNSSVLSSTEVTTTLSPFFCHGNSTQLTPVLFVLLSLRREGGNIMCWYHLKSFKRFKRFTY